MKKLNFIFIFLFLAAACHARTITVDDDGPADFDNIQAAIDDANNDDVIVVAEGTYRENINFSGKNIILTSTDPNNSEVVEGTIIQGDGKTSVVTFSGSEQISCELRGFTITGGNNPKAGGGIHGNSTKAAISHCIVYGNKSKHSAGGISRCDGLISHCTVTNNTSDSTGGIGGCKAIITNCNISNNGGRIYGGLSDCWGLISNCTISNNIGHGLLYCYGEISNCIISGNTKSGLAGCRGGPIHNCVIIGNTGEGVIGCGSIDSCIIVGNTGKYGGGLSDCDFISNCIIVGNSALYGGGIFCDDGNTTVVNCTISNNKANEDGGGICCIGSDAVVANSILWANKSKWGWDNEMALIENFICIIGQSCIYIPSTATVSYSDVKGGTEEVYADANCTLIWGDGNIDADPCFANPADYHLKSQAGRWDPIGKQWIIDDVTSPCIDAGDPSSPIGLEPFPNGGIINMGAYGGTVEASKSYFGEPVCGTIVAGDINGDCKVDFKDFALFAFHWLEEH